MKGSGAERGEIYTVTVVRNLGSPVSFSMKRRKLIFLLIIIILVSGFLLYSSAVCLLLRQRADRLSAELEDSERRVRILSGRIRIIERGRYRRGSAEENSAVGAVILERPGFSTEGIWITDNSVPDPGAGESGSPVRAVKLEASVRGNLLRLNVGLQNLSAPPAVSGGFLCITLVNRDLSPALYRSVSGGNTGENGFPSSYKLGGRYYLKKRTSSREVRFRLTEADEYYTGAVVFLFSYKGRLLARDEFELDRAVFLE